MAHWRCPSCGTPQAEAARCWVCARSSTTCSSCLHFRHGVAGGLGTCGLEARRGPLRGDEIRPCWAPSETSPAVPDGLFASASPPVRSR